MCVSMGVKHVFVLKIRLSGSNLYTGLNLRKLVHDWQDGFHGAAGAQVRLVAHEDDGNPTAKKRTFFMESPKK